MCANHITDYFSDRQDGKFCSRKRILKKNRLLVRDREKGKEEKRKEKNDRESSAKN